MDLTKTDCKICNALSAKGREHFFNTVFIESANFAHITALDPTTPGHTLVVSKRHFVSLSEMDSKEIVELQDFINNILRSKNVTDFMLFEHGGANQERGGSCVFHMHIHILPFLSNYYDVLDEMLPNIEVENLLDIRSIDYPYILSLNQWGRIKVYTAYNVHSRMMLKAIASKNKGSEYSLELNDVNLIKQSIQYWAAI